MKSKRLIAIIIAITGVVTISLNVGEQSNQKKNIVQNKILLSNYDNGQNQSIWKKEGNNWIYINNSGVMQTGWLNQDRAWYYLNSSGSMATSWNNINNEWYYFNNSGVMQTGWLNQDGAWYYLNSSGSMATGWNNINNEWYYFNNSGVMQTGWSNQDGAWYYLNSSGPMATGWNNINNEWYYFNNSGVMQTGWLNQDGAWYYLNSSGSMATGWSNINNEWYYFNNSGVMQTGEKVINGKSYTFNNSGTLTISNHIKLEAAPIIKAENITIMQGQKFNNTMLNAGTNEKDTKITYSGEVNTNKVGIYDIKIIATNVQGKSSSETVKVTVKEKSEAAPIIKAENITIIQGQKFNNAMLKAVTNEKDTKITYSGEVNTNKVGVYDIKITVTNAQNISSIKIVKVTVKEKQEVAPIISAQNITINQYQKFSDSLLKATTNEKNVKLAYSGNVNTKVPGVYQITIIAVNSQQQVSGKIVNVTVKEMPPIIMAHDMIIEQGSKFNNLMIDACSNQHDVKFNYSGNVNTHKVGIYNIKITATNKNRQTSTKIITVTVKATLPPIIIAKNITINQGDKFNNSMIVAYSNQHDVKFNYSGNINTNEAGVYNIKITATNKNGQTSTKIITVTVKYVACKVQYVTYFNDKQVDLNTEVGEDGTQSKYIKPKNIPTDALLINTVVDNVPLVGNYIKTTKVIFKYGTQYVYYFYYARPKNLILSAKNITINQGSVFNYNMLDAKSNNPIEYIGKVNTKVPGVYKVKVLSTYNLNFNYMSSITLNKTVYVTVKAIAKN